MPGCVRWVLGDECLGWVGQQVVRTIYPVSPAAFDLYWCCCLCRLFLSVGPSLYQSVCTFMCVFVSVDHAPCVYRSVLLCVCVGVTVSISVCVSVRVQPSFCVWALVCFSASSLCGCWFCASGTLRRGQPLLTLSSAVCRRARARRSGPEPLFGLAISRIPICSPARQVANRLTRMVGKRKRAQ